MVVVRMIMEMVKSAEERAERLAFEKDGLVVQCVTAVCPSDLFDFRYHRTVPLCINSVGGEGSTRNKLSRAS